MRNVTIRLDDETARWARLEAARKDTSVSRLVGELLRNHMQQSEEYGRAHRSYRSRRSQQLTATGERYPNRDEVHAR